MPRAKRPLETADSNANSKAPKLIHSDPDCPVKKAEEGRATKPKKHLLDVDIAERFGSSSHMMRLNRTYADLHMGEMKELLDERGLKKAGRKADLIARLAKWDDEHPSGKKKVGDDHKEEVEKAPVFIGAKASKKGVKGEDPHETILRRGPRGPPVYDEMGFELDYGKCAGSSSMPSKSTMLNNMDRMMDKHDREDEVKRRVMGWTQAQVKACDDWALNDRISRDLNIPFHKVTIDKFEEWAEKGFKVKPEDFDKTKMSKKENDRLGLLAAGSVFRK